jgi:hypothetical protein
MPLQVKLIGQGGVPRLAEVDLTDTDSPRKSNMEDILSKI